MVSQHDAKQRLSMALTGHRVPPMSAYTARVSGHRELIVGCRLWAVQRLLPNIILQRMSIQLLAFNLLVPSLCCETGAWRATDEGKSFVRLGNGEACMRSMAIVRRLGGSVAQS